jgi:hypothetical protein
MMGHGCHQDKASLNLTQFAIALVALNIFIQIMLQIIQSITQLLTLDLITMLLEPVKA